MDGFKKTRAAIGLLAIVALGTLTGIAAVHYYRVATPNYTTGNFEKYLPKGSKIAVLTADWCGYCRKAKAYLNSRQVSYIEYDVTSQRGREIHQELGMSSVPVTLIGDRLIVGYRPDEFDAALDKRN